MKSLAKELSAANSQKAIVLATHSRHIVPEADVIQAVQRAKSPHEGGLALEIKLRALEKLGRVRIVLGGSRQAEVVRRDSGTPSHGRHV